MRQLLEIDLQNYENCDSIFSRPSVRGIILKDNSKITLVYSEKEKYYKFPGGGIHKDEIRKKLLFGRLGKRLG